MGLEFFGAPIHQTLNNDARAFMTESQQFILSIGVLIAGYYLTRKGHAWREKRAYMYVLKDLHQKDALSPASAVELPYTRDSIFKFGMRNYRSKAVEPLLAGDIIRRTEDGRFYLNKPEILDLNT